jgi:hypothetical protein
MDGSQSPHVLHGTCGWSDPSIGTCGKFYPAGIRSAEQRLAHYSRRFPCVEVALDLLQPLHTASEVVKLASQACPPWNCFPQVDSSTYAIPRPATTSAWVKQVGYWVRLSNGLVSWHQCLTDVAQSAPDFMAGHHTCLTCCMTIRPPDCRPLLGCSDTLQLQVPLQGVWPLHTPEHCG